MLENLAIGLGVALTLNHLFYCFVGVTLGTFLGVLPGIGALVSMSLLFPITFHLQPTEAIIMLAGIYYGTAYGGSTAAILLNLPGTPSSAVTCLDGYPMTKQGRAGVALLMTASASFLGGSVGIVIMMLFSPLIAFFALRFGAPEYFALMLLGLIASTVVSSGPAAKGLAMVVLGMSLGIVGVDTNTNVLRYTFGFTNLWDGLALVTVAMGMFGLAEVIAGARTNSATGGSRVTLESMRPTRDDVSRSWLPILRGAGIGSLFGALPGTGGTIAAFISYAVERQVSRWPNRFGNGAIEGIVGPESANNAADQTAFIPTLMLGIPGSAAMALIIGVLMIHGITPGPRLLTDSPDLFWGLIMSFWIGNLMLLVLNIPMVGLWVRILMIPYHLLYPSILAFICIGAYTVHNVVFDIWMVMLFGVLGYAMRVLAFPAAPLILGFVLGPGMEDNFRRTLLLSDGDLVVFVERPVSGTLVAVSALLLAWTLVKSRGRVRRMTGDE